MYIVYSLRGKDGKLLKRPDINAMFARKGGSIIRADMLSHVYPGITFYVGVLPEGNPPLTGLCTEIIHTARQNEKEVTHAQS